MPKPSVMDCNTNYYRHSFFCFVFDDFGDNSAHTLTSLCVCFTSSEWDTNASLSSNFSAFRVSSDWKVSLDKGAAPSFLAWEVSYSGNNDYYWSVIYEGYIYPARKKLRRKS